MRKQNLNLILEHQEVRMESLLGMVGLKANHMRPKMHLMAKAANLVIHSYLMHHWMQMNSVMTRNLLIPDLLQKVVRSRSCH